MSASISAGISANEVPGASGVATERSYRIGEVRLRLIRYSRLYRADRWCAKGHALHVVEGALTIEYRSERRAEELSAGMSWVVAEHDAPPHRVRCENGAMIVLFEDG